MDIFNHDMGNNIHVFILHFISFSLVSAFILHLDINVICNYKNAFSILYFPIIHVCLFELNSLDNAYLNIYVYLVHLGQNPIYINKTFYTQRFYFSYFLVTDKKIICTMHISKTLFL